MYNKVLDTKAAEHPQLHTQQIGGVCTSQKLRINKKICWYLVVIAIGIVLSAAAWFIFKPAGFVHPDFAKDAVRGIPKVDSEKFGYSQLDITKGYSVKLCAVPANDGQNIELYLTNPKDNTVWIRAEIQDKKGNVLGSTDVLKQGEYLQTVKLDKMLVERENPVVIRIIAYEPHKWTSRGSVNLESKIYKDYR